MPAAAVQMSGCQHRPGAWFAGVRDEQVDIIVKSRCVPSVAAVRDIDLHRHYAHRAAPPRPRAHRRFAHWQRHQPHPVLAAPRRTAHWRRDWRFWRATLTRDGSNSPVRPHPAALVARTPPGPQSVCIAVTLRSKMRASRGISHAAQLIPAHRSVLPNVGHVVSVGERSTD